MATTRSGQHTPGHTPGHHSRTRKGNCAATAGGDLQEDRVHRGSRPRGDASAAARTHGGARSAAGQGAQHHPSTLLDTLALALWMGWMHVNVALLLLGQLLLAYPYNVLALMLHAALAVFPPLGEQPPEWGRRLAAFIVRTAQRVLPATIEMEDEGAFKPDKPYLIELRQSSFGTPFGSSEALTGIGRTAFTGTLTGLEPHSVLPMSLIHFGNGGSLLPPALQGEGRKMAFASSIVFCCPLLRHVWTWLGLRPASRASISKYLAEGRACVLIPGGVQECLHLKHDVETLYLSKRIGFVKLALRHGAPLVPAFAFGQCNAYKWYRPGPPLVPQSMMSAFSRLIGICPIVFWGQWGGPLPFLKPIHCVVGTPIELPHVSEPTVEQAREYLDKYIEAIKLLFEMHRHKHPESIQKLVVL